MVVVDASVAMGWFVASQATELSRSVLVAVGREAGLVPAHFGIEMARALRNQERRGLMTASDVDRSLVDLRTLRLTQDTASTLDLGGRLVELARRHTLRIADATYLELAMRAQMPIATSDAALMRVAQQVGVGNFTG
jgi:predicted nucleic acid-binding protein